MSTEITPLMKAQAEATAFAVEHGYALKPASANERLADGLRRCLDAEAHLEEIILTVPEAEDPDNPIEVDAMQWKRDMIRHQVHRAARASRERRTHLLTLRDDEDWEQERIRCGMRPRNTEDDDADRKMHTLTVEHLRHWFRYWAWAYDPRADYMPLQPFVPFGLYEDDEATFQWEYVGWLHKTTFVRRKSGTVEKARDMGATLGWLLWSTCCWLGADFYSALLSSANADLVDSSKDPDTLFEKVRFALRMHPPQLLPEGFDLVKGMPYMNISNPENGSTLSGQAPTENAGRQKRRTCLLKDEFAAWPYGGFPQETALSAVSYSPFDVSSVQGEYNQFSKTAHQANCNKFIMDWRDHPWKDKRWYDALPFGFVGPPMSAETIAQEVDRDYQASQPGKVFKDWGAAIPRAVIEWPELLAYFTKMGYGDRFKYVDGSLKLPDEWNYARMQDKGETEGHPRMTLYCAKPPEHWPLSDSTFFFIEHMAPTAADLGTVVQELTQCQRDFHIENRRPVKSLLSHEASNDQNIYLKDFGWNWQKWDTDYDSGIGNIRLWIKPIDMHKENPIRPVLMGRTRMYLVCAKGQATLAFNEKDKKHFVTPAKATVLGPKDTQGFARLRAEMPVYHYPPEEAGKPVLQQRPARIFDDSIACFVKGTLVLTDRGQIPIEQIQASDLIATRYGWQRLVKAWQTSQNAVIFRLTLSDGTTLEGTGEHPIWANGAWKELQHLQPGDEVEPSQKWWSTRESNSTGTLTPSTRPIATISSPTFTRLNRASRLCMLKCGKIIMDWYRQATTYTTRTDLGTISRTWSVLATASTNFDTDRYFPRMRNLADWLRSSSQRSRTKRPVLIAQPRLSPSIRDLNTANLFAKPGCEQGRYPAPWKERVSFALNRLLPNRVPIESFAAGLALAGTTKALSTHPKNTGLGASTVEPRKRSRATTLDSVRVSVKAVPVMIGYAPVYNLTVENQPEYFANGILVHNCLRSIAVVFGPRPKAETPEEKRRKRMAPEIQPGRIHQLSVDDPERDAIILSQQIWNQEFDEEERGGPDVPVGFAPIRVIRSTPRKR